MPKVGPHKEYRLNANFVENAPPGRHTDGGGLYLVVDKSGARRWMLRLTIRGTGRRREYGLGSTRLVKLMDARKKALEYRALAAVGKDPILEREHKAAQTMTFKKACERYYQEEVLTTGRNGKHKQQFVNTMRTYAYPVLENISVDDIGPRHIAEVLRPIWNTKRETATRVRQRLKSILDWATWYEFRTGDNPVLVVKLKGEQVKWRGLCAG